MNRLLTQLSAAICFAVCASDVFAGPLACDVEPAVTPTAGALNGSNGPIPSALTLLPSPGDGGFAASEITAGAASGVSAAASVVTFDAPTTRVKVDVSDFISPTWTLSDPEVEAFSSPIAQGEAAPFTQFALVTSSDVNTLSVPEIPLPAALVPGLIGVGLIAAAHRRTLAARKMTR